ncbi:histidinol dehydrogenase [Sphingobacterium alkalisoli]|uniref:Histidinol dehydrogenase n=2 Tax=Sphingobacterium TaxID=28453 RepID=A0A4U0NGC0_9SPHI|nr:MULTISPECIES: histidinol dehydrogenase [Sphingobacterium]TJY63991.1 histidinol dehydrogenase [Sphingobacterium alkalisoli]TJZ53197.1 histidinol dehydrogenase [Sphingobacterium olei]GGH23594.1 histidinol dehydrogenase [Sphingobacterium alkalisoli]
MLKTYHYNNLSREEIDELVIRNTDPNDAILETVISIVEEVKTNGDPSLRNFAAKFDQVEIDQLYLDESDIDLLAATISRDQQRALEIAFQNIHKFHSTQLRKERVVETMPGVKCWREVRPIEKVGLYIPGGSAVLPSTLLMLGVPARIAGCREIVVCSPPQKSGKINGFVAYCLKLLQIKRIYLVGGAQAVAAMAYGTESIPKVDKIFGPGNQFVTKAKSFIQGKTNVSIDMPAGPSEVLVIADKSANPAFVAADLLAQAEHGVDSQAVLVSTDIDLIQAVNDELAKQLAVLPRAELAQKAIENSYAILTEDLREAIQFSNVYAPEHLILETDNWQTITSLILNAGSVFLGHLTPESAGDYASGTNHTLPTSGYARSYSGVSVDSFVKKITFQHISAEGLEQIGSTVEILAELEGLHAHKNAVSIRKT